MMPRKAMVSTPEQTPEPEVFAATPEQPGSREPRETAREPKGRRERIPLGGPRAKLKAAKIPGYKTRWVNDTGDRLQQAQNAGYEFVTDDREKISKAVGTSEAGNPLRAYLMKQPEDFYREDQSAKQAEVDKLEASIKRGAVQGAQGQDAHGFYVPDQGIKIGRG